MTRYEAYRRSFFNKSSMRRVSAGGERRWTEGGSEGGTVGGRHGGEGGREGGKRGM